MKIRFTVELSKRQLRAINHYFGEASPASREQAISHLELIIGSALNRLEDDLVRAEKEELNDLA